LVASLDPDERSEVMFVSIVGSILSISYLIATFELDVESSVHALTNGGGVVGYLPLDNQQRQAVVMVGIILFTSGYLAAKLIAIAVFARASFVVVVAWCTVEFWVLFALRYVAEEGKWRFHTAGLDTLVPSFFSQILFYLNMLAAPFPFLRSPNYVGPTLWFGWVAYSLLVNPIMVLLGFRSGQAGSNVSTPEAEAWLALGMSSCSSLIGALLMAVFMNKSHRRTFYSPNSFVRHADELWEERTLLHFSDGSFATGHDASRGNIIKMSAKFWVSTEKLRTWLASWDEWEAEQPRWFADESLKFQKRIIKYAPPDALPPTVLRVILARARDTDGNKYKLDADLDAATLVSMVKKHRQETRARERARRLAKAVLAIRLYIIAIVMSYVDLAGDVLVALTLLQSETSKQSGYVTMGLTGFAQVVQAIISLAMGQGGVAAFTALIGAKPLLDTYNMLSNRPLTRGTKADHEMAFTATRGEEVALQSLPQGFYQCLVLLQMAQAGETTSWVQWASVGGAALSVAFIVADTDHGVDTSASYQLDHPLVHGYTPKDKRRAWLVSLGTFGFVGGTLVSKWVAIATLATASGSVAAVWLVTDCVVLLVLRQIVEGSWRFGIIRGLDAALPSALVHLMFYILSVAAPFPLLRFPGFLGPSVYCASVCYQTIASPLMLLVAFSMEGGGVMPQAELWAILGVATVVLLVGASLMGCYMVPEYRKTFYQVMRGINTMLLVCFTSRYQP